MTTTVFLQATADTYADSQNPNTNSGSTGGLWLMKYSVNDRKWPFLKFDISTIPPNATITSAILRVTRVPGLSHYDLTLIRVNGAAASWVETTLTWNNKPALDSTEYDNHTSAGVPYDVNSWTITALVQRWMDGSLANNGLCVNGGTNYDTANYQTYFGSREHATEAYRPVLEITYVTVISSPEDTYLNSSGPTLNYGASSLCYSGYGAGGIDYNYLHYLSPHSIPLGDITSVTLQLYISLGVWSGGTENQLRMMRIMNANQWTAGDKSAATGTDFDATWSKANNSVNWLGNATNGGCDISGTDYTAWQAGDPEITLSAGFAAGYKTFTIPTSWLTDWRDSGQNAGIIMKCTKQDGTRDSNSNVVQIDSVDGTNPPIWTINITPGTGTSLKQLISNRGALLATFDSGTRKLAIDSLGNTYACYHTCDDQVAILKRTATTGAWSAFYTTSHNKLYQAPTIMLDTNERIHLIYIRYAPDGGLPHLVEVIATNPRDITAWGPELTIFDDTLSNGYLGADIDTNNRIHVMWFYTNNTASPRDLRYTFKDLGGSWQTPQTIITGTMEHSPIYPTLFVNSTNNDLHTVVSVNEGVASTPLHVVYMKSTNADTAATPSAVTWFKSDGVTQYTIPITDFNNEEKIEALGGLYDRPFGNSLIVAADGKAHVSMYMRRISDQNYHIKHCRVNGDGTYTYSWVNGTTLQSAKPVLMQDSLGKIYTVYIDLNTESYGDIFYRRTSDYGDNWDTPGRITSDGYPDQGNAFWWYPSSQRDALGTIEFIAQRSNESWTEILFYRKPISNTAVFMKYYRGLRI